MRNLYQLLSDGRTLDEAAARVGLQRYDYLAREVRFFEGITPEELFLEAESDESDTAETPRALPAVPQRGTIAALVSPSSQSGQAD
ncbi:MAG: hypothetical protein HOI66_02780 [Verrucomicrobia bacterium]|mgnify:FL=1|nr:hypothetical protein [Verrucomicrobiota bacterium]